MKVEDTLQSLLAETLKRSVGTNEDVVRAEEPGWNSLVHMELVFMIEDEFGIEFEPDEIAELTSRCEIAARVEAHIEALDS